ncbi:hypothetical protein HHK36_009021 [Tetracentron sinense]|uniref:FAD synthase n=1 Tax=Tetracentron sinense TaxID=13715 RepID=A0A834ZCV0_TETSI|nr:hypothetical protein HHK36_009021 [Tetracentron sinense]
MYVGDVEEDKRREMRGVGGPLLCISDLLSDVGEGDGGDPSSSLSISISNPNDHLPHLDLCQLFQLLLMRIFCNSCYGTRGLDIFRLPAFVVSGRASYRRLYLSGIGFGIEDFSTLHRRPETRKLGRAILTTTKEHARPNNMYRALYLWCLETNTFVIGHGEAGISFWEMKQISRLSIQGEYNEETIPNFSELIESDIDLRHVAYLPTVRFAISFQIWGNLCDKRAPIVAKCDRKRVLSLWAPHCGNVAPDEFHVEFVEKLSKELGVCGVVAGENYRFGYKAAGDASELVRLREEYGLRAYIISSIMDKNQFSRNIGSGNSKERGQVSSTRVRGALAEGDMKYVSELLGRQHHLMLMMTDQGMKSSETRMSAPKCCLLNLPPREGLYENCSLFYGDKILVPCRTVIDTTHIHLESDDLCSWMNVPFRDCRLVGIEFGDSRI